MNLLYLSKKQRETERMKPNNTCREMFECVLDISMRGVVNVRGCCYISEIASDAFSRALSRVTGVCYTSADAG